MERIEIIENDELKDLLINLKEVDKKVVSLVEESEERQKQFDTETMIRQKIVDKMKPIANELFAGTMGEFETLANLTIDDEGVIRARIVDELESWKESRRKAKEVQHDPAEELPETE